jgi:hypothetical protein
MAWQTPFLSVLTGTDKDALQRIFSSLQEELQRIETAIRNLEQQGDSKMGQQKR